MFRVVYSQLRCERDLPREVATAMCVLIVDDDKLALHLLATYIRRLGYTVIEAESGQEALRILADPGSPTVDLMLTDIWMPRMSGLELLEEVRREEPDLPIAVITGVATLDSSIAALNTGAYAYLTKPIQIEQLRDVLCRGFHKRDDSRARRSLQQNLLERYEELERHLETLQERQPDMPQRTDEDLLNELIRGLRHELGNATTAIKLNLSVLEDEGNNPSNLREHLRDLQASADHLVQLLAKLREYPKPGLVTELIDLRQVLLSLQDLARTEIEGHHAQLEFVLPDDEAPVQAATLELSRALMHILENAIEANGKMDHHTVRISTIIEGSTVITTISDDGPGFPTEILDKPFSPGFTTKTTGGVMRGLGLGLFIARAVIDLHSGQIWLVNRPEGGASVFIQLPLADPGPSAED